MNWLCTLDVKDIWESYDQPDGCPHAFLEKIIHKFETLETPSSAKAGKKELLEKLNELNVDLRSGLFDNDKPGFGEEFNGLWKEVYDWADALVKPGQKVCWIKTF